MRASRVLLAAATLSIGVSGVATAAEFNWKFQAFLGENSLVTQEFQGFAERLKEKSGGRIEIEVLPGGAVVGNAETLEAMQAGVLNGHYNAPSYFAGKDPAFAVLGDTLSAYKDSAQRDSWFTEGGGLALARELYGQNGAHFVGSVYWPPEWIPSKKPLNTIADFEGLKIRAPEGLVGDLLRRAGAGVVSLPGGEVYNALETGVLDATDWANMALNNASGLYRVAKYSVFARHSMAVTEISIRQQDWDALPADLRSLVEAEVAAFSDHMRKAFAAAEDKAAEEVKAQDVALIVWSDQQEAQFRAMLKEVWGEWESKNALSGQIIASHKAYLQKLGL